MIPDAECLKIVHEILSQLDLGDFRIKVWQRVNDGSSGDGRGLCLKEQHLLSLGQRQTHPGRHVRSVWRSRRQVPHHLLHSGQTGQGRITEAGRSSIRLNYTSSPLVWWQCSCDTHSSGSIRSAGATVDWFKQLLGTKNLKSYWHFNLLLKASELKIIKHME